ncbi:dimethyl sulfoxide reductase anchor subunit family protein [Desulfovibrio litoralis]|uniref:DMSO reductase anchor subunit n=1 Tax=Desulfovibrio litoralis DSM 11393 TaxID=1121455 RepID=A0A1M7TCI7_9BACT|nr:DmsC/YnfH family molybdoenzyme membrane anchor subunit [Desulfovibrio litoralis]SHN68479.1 DMSO reductase anchor subunit [Desulfovibrio litoralis DSM 11393]
MITVQWSLVVFTVLIQLSAGLALLIWLTGLKKFPKTEKVAWIITFLSGVIGFGGAVLHLTMLAHAPYALTQVGHAWLSREILGVSIFGLLVLLRVLNILKAGLNPLIALAGLGLILVVSQVYRVDVVPFWNTIGTEIGFFGTALALGGAVLAMLSNCNPEIAESSTPFISKWLCAIGLFMSCCLVLFGLHNMMNTIAPELIADTTTLIIQLAVAHTLIAGLGCALLFGNKNHTPVIALFAFLVILGGEVIGRILFYLANIRIGI